MLPHANILCVIRYNLRESSTREQPTILKEEEAKGRNEGGQNSLLRLAGTAMYYQPAWSDSTKPIHAPQKNPTGRTKADHAPAAHQGPVLLAPHDRYYRRASTGTTGLGTGSGTGHARRLTVYPGPRASFYRYQHRWNRRYHRPHPKTSRSGPSICPSTVMLFIYCNA
jgi:hypothetical protein